MTDIELSKFLPRIVVALREDPSRGRGYVRSIYPELGKGQADRLAAMAQGILFHASTTQSSKEDALGGNILAALRKAGVNGTTIAELSAGLGVSEHDIEEVIVSLQARKYMIEADFPHIRLRTWVEKQGTVKVDVSKYANYPDFCFGVIADTHLGSKYARPDIMESLYDIFQLEGVSFVYHLGNLIDGYRHNLNAGDLLPGMDRLDNQVEHALDNYPKRDHITTRFITADCHEGWWIRPVGINVGEYIEMRAHKRGRDDLRWIGHIEVDIAFWLGEGQAVVRLVHPGDGSAYAASYPMQRLIESYAMDDVPNILLSGHYHKYLTMRSRDCNIVMGGCCQDQTPFLRKKKIQAHLGGVVVRCQFDEQGNTVRFATEWFPFNTEKYYENRKLYLPL